jgi:hypothetical protein
MEKIAALRAMPRRLPRWAKATMWASAILVVLILGPHLYCAICIQWQLHCLREEGYPVTTEELDAWYPPLPAEENAAEVYARALDSFVFLSDPKYQVFGRNGDAYSFWMLTTLDEQDAARWLAANQECLALLLRAADMRKSQPLPLSRWLTKTRWAGPQPVCMEDLCRLLDMAAEDCARKGDAAGATAAIRAIVSATRALESERYSPSGRTWPNAYDTSRDLLWRTLSLVQFTDEQLRMIAVALNEPLRPDGETRALVGDLCETEVFFRGAPSSLANELGSLCVPWRLKEFDSTLTFLYSVTPLWAADRLCYLRMMRRAIGISRLPDATQRKRAFAELEEEQEHVAELHVFARSMLQRRKYGQWEVNVFPADACAVTTIAVERFWLAGGRLPETLQDLVPEFLVTLPSDPYDGKPLRYRRTDTGYMVYSVGPDRTDDGGRVWVSQEATPTSDIVFSVSR